LHGLPVSQPGSLKSEEALAPLRKARVDVLVVAAYGLILPQAFLDVPRLGALNIHASLLPRWRGAAPIQRALLAGDRETGISIMQMDAGLDTGPVLAQTAMPIFAEDDAGTLHDRLAALGAEMVVAAMQDLQRGRVDGRPQPSIGVTYAAKITRDDARLDWKRPAEELERVVRAFRPSPGASTTLDGAPLKIWRASVQTGDAPAGSLAVAGDFLVAGCGKDLLRIEELQRSGGRRMRSAEFLRGSRIEPGAHLG
jgi:methionyl-tRNA formyltransferase